VESKPDCRGPGVRGLSPQHDELGPGLLRKLIRQADLIVVEFNDL